MAPQSAEPGNASICFVLFLLHLHTSLRPRQKAKAHERQSPNASDKALVEEEEEEPESNDFPRRTNNVSRVTVFHS